jgi:hypothetical protein
VVALAAVLVAEASLAVVLVVVGKFSVRRRQYSVSSRSLQFKFLNFSGNNIAH